MKANVLDMLVVLFDEADEEDVSGCGWLVGWLAGWLAAKPKNQAKRNINSDDVWPRAVFFMGLVCKDMIVIAVHIFVYQCAREQKREVLDGQVLKQFQNADLALF